MRLRQLLRAYVPLSSRQSLASGLRWVRDRISAVHLSNETTDRDLTAYHVAASLTQTIMPSALFENKLANLTIGAQRVQHSLIKPNQVWSFWQFVKKPNEPNGFVVGRNLVNGVLTRQVGGGICQLSSLIYHVALMAGLEVVERHAHSIDIYQEHERFTPLGADATVVWGVKDLRLSNPHPFDIVLTCHVGSNYITAQILAQQPTQTWPVTFTLEVIGPQQVKVLTSVDGLPHTLTEYEQRQGMALQQTPPKADAMMQK